MSFVNLIPDVTPAGVPLPLTSGLRFFYFMFVAPSRSVDFYLSRNRYSNEEFITRLYIEGNSTSLLTSTYVRNVSFPTSFFSGRIGLSIPSGITYANNTSIPNCRIVNLIQGAVYYIESRTIYNDPGTDFGLRIVSGLGTAPLTYLRTETSSIPFPPLPPPPPPLPPPPSPTDIPNPPTGLVATSGTFGVVLEWNEMVHTVFYNVYRFGRFIGRTANIRFIDSHAISGGLYSYVISAENNNGESVLTNPVTITPIFLFTDLIPDRMPDGISLVGIGIRYFYFLFTPVTSTLDAFLHCNGIVNQSAIIGIYDTTNPVINLLNITNTISNLDSNVILGNFTLGTDPDPQLSVYGLRLTAISAYSNTTSIPNFRINNLVGLNTYILEVACINNMADNNFSDLAMYFKNADSGLFEGYTTQILYNTTSLTRVIPKPYVISYAFQINTTNYTRYIYPNLQVFQNAKSVLEHIITKSPDARATGRNNDMVVNFTVETLPTGVVGQSVLTRWKDDRERSPDFPYEQNITFSSQYFQSGYFTSNARFNGSQALNSITNTGLFNTLIHEMLHGIGLFYTSFYNTSNQDIGWSPFLTNVAEGNPWYRGPTVGNSEALQSYKLNCRNSNLLRIPIENNYGAGTAISHWDEGDSPLSSSDKRYFNAIYHPAFRLELMTGFLNRDDYFTGLTAGALKDYGYTVNMNSPYVAAYPSQLIPSASVEPDFEKDCCYTCKCEGGRHIIIDDSLVKEDIEPLKFTTNVILYF